MSKRTVKESSYWWAALLAVAALALLMAAYTADVVRDLEETVDGRADIGGWVNAYGTPVPKPTETPTAELVDMGIPVAVLDGYADIEATRIAKMAHLMLGMGGEFTAKAELIYNSVTNQVEAKYSITWRRKGTGKGLVTIKGSEGEDKHAGILKEWAGANWGECIGKMMAWRGGE